MASKFGIDISRWQGNFILSDAVKNHGVQFAILKIGGADSATPYKDSKFDDYYKQAKAIGLPIGCYYFSKALSIEDAKKEVTHWLSLMKGKQFEYPVFVDIENKTQLAVGKNKLTSIAYYICEELEKAGYWAGIYSSESFFKTYFDDSKLQRFTHWYARWSKTAPNVQNLQMWQFGGETNLIRSNKINGITVDQDYCYVDYPTLIKNKGLNGYGKQAPVKKKTNAEIAKEVLEGKWGNSPERKVRLTEAGYNYSSIQTLVNKMVKEGK